MTLKLNFPTSPYVVTQKWGVKNDAYLRFGFCKHNGIDFVVDTDCRASAMCDGTVTGIGYSPNGAGNWVKYRTGLVECEGEECYVEFMYMHAEKILVKVGERVKLGQDLIIADNTGFSTGAHTHISAYRYAKDGLTRIDKDPETNFTFDFSRYFNIFQVDISYGEKSHNVEILQTVLSQMGYFKYEITGYYGEITRKAVFQFQQDYCDLNWYEKWVLMGKNVGRKTRLALNNLT